MKRFSLFLLASLLFTACSEANIEEYSPIPERKQIPETIYVSLDDQTSRVQLNTEGKTVWTEGDFLTAFYQTDGNSKFKFRGKTGDRSGGFTVTEMNEGTTEIDEVILLYPYSADYKLNATKKTVKVNIPAEQHYSEGSYGVGANLMASVETGSDFSLKSLCGWISIQLKGAGSVTSVTLTGNNGEQLAGDATFHYDEMNLKLLYYPSAPGDDSEVGGSLIFGDFQETTTLICDEPVELHYTEPTEFYFVVPPQTFSQGITIEATCSDGTVLTKSTSKELVIERNHIVPMSPLTVMEQQPANEIWYTSTDGNIVEPFNPNGFGANIVSNSYESGQGVMTFDGPVTEIGDEAFYKCNTLSNITIPESVSSIGFQAFTLCENLTSIDIPDNVAEIELAAFSACKNLKKVKLPSELTAITADLFVTCYSLTDIAIPDGVTSIGDNALSFCTSLTSVTIPDSVTEIGDYAFYCCDSLASVTIPDGVTSIGSGAFQFCFLMTAFYGKFASEDNLCLIVDGVLHAFAVGSGVTEYTIPDSVTSIGDYVFGYCDKLTTVTIPDGVTSIGDWAFCDCHNLTSVYCKPTTPPSAIYSELWEAFDNIAEGAKIYVPAESVEAYKAADGWSDYADMICAQSQPTNEIWYTSSDGEIVVPNNATGFGTNIVSNTYPNGKGVITFDGPVTGIGDRAFYNCYSLASVTIPDGVTSIGDRAFYDCDSLGSVTIPDGVTSIGEEAFLGCRLESVTIPDSVTEIGDSAFARCTSLTAFYGKFATEDNRCLIVDGALNSFAPSGLTEYAIPDGVTSIGHDAFHECSGLKSIDIPDSVASIEERAFSQCTSLTSVTIPDKVTTIEYCVFYNCSSLTDVIIPQSIISIEDQAFLLCYNLSKIYCEASIPPSATGNTLDWRAFDNIAEGAKIYVPAESVEAYKAADGWSDYADMIFADPRVIYYTSTNGEIIEPNNKDAFGANIVSNTYANGKGVMAFDGPVTSIGYAAFGYCDKLTTVTIPDGVTSIGLSAFECCENMTAFYGKYASVDNRCLIVDGVLNSFAPAGLTKYTIPDGVTSIGVDAFLGCTGLTSVTIPDSVTEIGDGTFDGCTSLTSVTIPNSVTEIGCAAFVGCTSLTSITIPDSVTSILGDTFHDCTSLTSVTIPEGVTEIGSQAFAFCAKLQSITIPKSVVKIGNEAFGGCSNLASVYISDINAWCEIEFKSIGSSPISNIDTTIYLDGEEITEVVIPEGTTEIKPYTFYGFFDLERVSIPEGVTTIGDSAFCYCYGLNEIYIPDSVTSIERYAFTSCRGLTSITIPDGVTEIGYGAFRSCISLTSVYCKPTTPPSLWEAFDNIAEGAKIYVPTESVEAYKAADGWSDYAALISPYIFD